MAIDAKEVMKLRRMTDAGMMDCKKALVESDGDMDKAIEVLRTKLAVKADKRSAKVAAEGVIKLAVSADNAQGFLVEINSETDFVSRDENFITLSDALLSQVVETGTTNVAEACDLTVAVGGEAKTFDAARQEVSSKVGENIKLRRIGHLAGEYVCGYAHGSRIGVLVVLDKSEPELAKDIAMHVAACNPRALNEAAVCQDVLAKEREIYTNQAKESGKPDNIIEKMVEGRVQKFLKEECLVSQPFVKCPDQTIADLLAEKGANVTAYLRYELGEGIEVATVDFAAEVQAQLKGD